MNFLVIGAGAIGCLVGGRLAQHGHTVTLVGRPRFVGAVNQQGLLLTDHRGDYTIQNIIASGSIMEAYETTRVHYDVAILTVKSYDTATALRELGEAIAKTDAEKPTLLSLQNGVGNEELIAKQLGSANVIAGTITTPVTILAPGEIKIEKPSSSLGISPWHPAVSVKTFKETEQALKGSEFSVTVYKNAQSMKWTKLLMNMLGNASSAILDAPPKEIFADPILVNLEIDAWREALAVMDAAKIPLVNIGSYPLGALATFVRRTPKALLRQVIRRQVSSGRGDKMPSLHIDLHGNKGKSEVSWLNGAVVKKGEELHIPTPINSMFTDTLLKLVQDDQRRALWKQNNLRLAVIADEYRER